MDRTLQRSATESEALSVEQPSKYINTYVNILYKLFRNAHFHNMELGYYIRLAKRINDIIHRIFIDYGVDVLASVIYKVCIITNNNKL